MKPDSPQKPPEFTSLFDRARDTPKNLPGASTPVLESVAAVLGDPNAEFSVSRLEIAFLIIVDNELATTRELSLSYLRLAELFEFLIRHDDPTSDMALAAKAATRSVNRLIDGRLLLLHIAAPTLAQGQFKLGPLGKEIARTFRFSDTAEVERLAAVLRRIRLTCSYVLELVEKGGAENWIVEVENELKHVIISLLNDIDRRQVNIDLHYDRMKKEVTGALNGPWQDALDRCEKILARATATAEELKNCLANEASDMRVLLVRLADLARAGGHVDTAESADTINDELRRLSRWAGDRFSAWARFHHQLMAWVNQMVRLDPDRVLARTVRIQLRRFVDDSKQRLDGEILAPYVLPIWRAQRHVRVRPPPDHKRAKPLQVVLQEPEIVVQEDDPLSIFEAEIHARICHLLKVHGEAMLHDLLLPYASLPAQDLSRLTGRTIEIMVELGLPEPFEVSQGFISLSTEVSAEPLRVIRCRNAINMS